MLCAPQAGRADRPESVSAVGWVMAAVKQQEGNLETFQFQHRALFNFFGNE